MVYDYSVCELHSHFIDRLTHPAEILQSDGECMETASLTF